jgi:hypothetical protein
MIEKIEEPERLETLNELIVYEIVESIRRKLINSIQNDKFTLELTEISAFRILLRTYETIGVCEAANAILLNEEIEKKIEGKLSMANSLIPNF